MYFVQTLEGRTIDSKSSLLSLLRLGLEKKSLKFFTWDPLINGDGRKSKERTRDFEQMTPGRKSTEVKKLLKVFQSSQTYYLYKKGIRRLKKQSFEGCNYSNCLWLMLFFIVLFGYNTI